MAKKRDYSKLLQELSEEYVRHSPASAALNERAVKVLIDGGSHNLRLVRPFPPRVVSAKGAYVTDEDGHRILDFWQGHFANILGHNPGVITSALARSFERGDGLQTGFTTRLQVEVAELVCRLTGAERVRFTTSGALATMYATLLARSFTNRSLVVKVGGGWHGAQPWGLKGVYYARSSSEHWQVDSAGLPGGAADEVIVSRFNDSEMLRQQFKQHGDHIACFIVEPFIGSGGYILATPEYLQTARQLADRYGALLIFDEVISGFRFRAGDLGRMYGVKPDLATFAKIMGGGMPVAAVAGREDILRQCGWEGGSKVRFSGGTYSGHTASLLAAKTMLEYLVAHEAEIYPYIGALGERLRQATEKAFASEGIAVRCTGYGNSAAPQSAMAMPHFVLDEKHSLTSPDDLNDPSICDVALREPILQVALLCHDIFVVHGLGAVSTAHTDADIARFAEACRRVARRLKPYVA
jgi:glutamate-1-semialdehyde 2,1-aminomutase